MRGLLLQIALSRHIFSVSADTGGQEVSHYGWNEDKAKLNKEKHGVSFEEAIEVLGESPVLYFGEDTTEDYPERRFCAAGFTRAERFLFIVYEEEEQDWIEDEKHRLFRHIIHAKDFERSHLRHFSCADSRAEIETLIRYREGQGHGRRRVQTPRKTKKGAGAKGKDKGSARLR